MATFGPLISTEWLAERIGDTALKIIDGSWRMPGSPPASLDFEKRHIAGAVFFDLDEIADHTSDLPHMLPVPDQFERQIGALGISADDTIVVYDDQGCFSAARVWWSFRAMGHSKVAVLDGGLPKWLAENRPVDCAKTPLTPRRYTAAFNPEFVCNAALLRSQLDQPNTTILDARPAPRFNGVAAEPREGLRSGHMPGATNLPFQALLKDDKTFLDPESLTVTLQDLGVEQGRCVITSCGSGVTAAILSLALELIGHNNHKLYDGSWAEWGDHRHSEREFPVVVETAK